MSTRSTPHEFAVAPPAHDPRLMVMLLIIQPELLACIVMFLILNRAHGNTAMMLGMRVGALGAVPTTIIFALVTALMWWAVQRRRIVLADGLLDVTATFYRRTLPVTSFDLDKARIINLDEHREWRPLFKTKGMGLPGLRAGWFRSRSFAKIFCLLTARDRVLLLPESTGGALLLSVAKPSELLDALRAADDGQRVRR